MDEVRAVNISRAIDALTDAGWNVVGLDGSAELTLDQAIASYQMRERRFGRTSEQLREAGRREEAAPRAAPDASLQPASAPYGFDFEASFRRMEALPTPTMDGN